jgi:hypothetical protein
MFSFELCLFVHLPAKWYFQDDIFLIYCLVIFVFTGTYLKLQSNAIGIPENEIVRKNN